MDMIEHRVRERAYYIWEGEGRVVGRADAHWFQAEAEFAAASVEAAPAAAVSVVEAAPKAVRAKAAKPAAPKTTAKAAASKTAAPKAAVKVAAAKAPPKPRKTPRAEVGISLH